MAGEPTEGVPDGIAMAHHDGVRPDDRAENVSHPIEDLARGLAASDRDVRVRPIDIGDCGESVRVVHTLQTSERLLAQPSVLAGYNAQPSADDLRGLHRSDEIAAQQHRSGDPGSRQIGSHRLRGSRRILATQLGQGRMGRSTLRAVMRIPHRFAVPDQIEHEPLRTGNAGNGAVTSPTFAAWWGSQRN